MLVYANSPRGQRENFATSTAGRMTRRQIPASGPAYWKSSAKKSFMCCQLRRAAASW